MTGNRISDMTALPTLPASGVTVPVVYNGANYGLDIAGELARIATVGLFSDLASTIVSEDADRIFTSGFSSVGVGAAQYRRVSAPPSDEQTEGTGYWIRQDAAGTWWKLDEPVPESDMFGTVGDATYNITTGAMAGTSATVAIQKMIHFTRYYGGGGRCRISKGRHLVDDWIHLSYGEGEVGMLHIEGYGKNYRGEFYQQGTVLVCSSTTKPPFVIQGARGLSVTGINFIGPMSFYIYDNNLGDPYAVDAGIDHTNVDNWIDPAVLASNANVNYRYSPLAAIAIDPFSGSQPATHYPDVTYPAFLGAMTQYSKTGSAFVDIRDCGFEGFVAALAVSPSDNDAQGDTIGFVDCLVEYCLFGLSVGNTQCRNVQFDNNVFTFVHTLITNRAHGKQNGKVHGSYNNNEVWGACIQLLDVTPAIGGPMEFANFYCEGMHRIGNYGSGAGGYHSPLAFRDSELSFAWYDGATRPVFGTPATVLSKASYAMVTFENCVFASFGEVMVFEGAPATFAFRNGCRVGDTLPGNDNGSGVARYSREDQYVSSNFMCNVMFAPSSTLPNRPSEFSVVSARTNIDTGTADTGGGLRDGFSLTKRAVNGCAWSKRFIPESVVSAVGVELQPQFWTPSTVTAADATQFNTGSIAGDTLTITAPNTMTGSLASQLFYGIYPGCVLFFETGSYVFLIEKYVAGVLTCRLINGLKGSGGTATVVGDGYTRGVAPTALSLTAGNVWIGNAAVFTPARPTLGDFTSGNTAVANVGQADAVATYVTTEFAVNDLLFIDQYTDPAHPATAYVAARSNGPPGSITLSANASQTVARRRIPLVVRGDIPNKP